MKIAWFVETWDKKRTEIDAVHEHLLRLKGQEVVVVGLTAGEDLVDAFRVESYLYGKFVNICGGGVALKAADGKLHRLVALRGDQTLIEKTARTDEATWPSRYARGSAPQRRNDPVRRPRRARGDLGTSPLRTVQPPEVSGP